MAECSPLSGEGRLRKLRGVETDAPRKKGRGTCLCAVKSSSFSGVRSRINAEPAQIWWFRGHFRKRAISTAGGDRAITESSEIGITLGYPRVHTYSNYRIGGSCTETP